MIDWVIAERIAAFVAGTGDGGLPTADLAELAAESEKRVTAYTGLKPAQPMLNEILFVFAHQFTKA